MSDFQSNLDEEMKKRQSTEAESTMDSGAVSSTSKKTKNKSRSKSFSFRSFFSGLVLCSVFTAALIGWAWYKAEATNAEIVEKLPSKTAIVEVLEDGYIENTQPVLTMPPIKDNTTEEKTIASNNTPSQSSSQPAPQSTTEETTPLNIDSDAKPFKIHSAAFTARTEKPLLSFVINDLGLSAKKTESIIQNFSKEIGLSFSPYSKNLSLLTDTAKKDGHEIWLALPLETKEYPLNDPGPSTLLVNASAEKNKSRLNDLLKSTQDYVGFISQPNHVFKTEDANVNPTIKEIFERGLAIIDGNMSLRSFIAPLADRNDYPYAQNNLWLDDDLAPLALNQKIRKISEYGKKDKNIIVMLRPYPASLKAVQKFLNSKAAEEFELAPVSAQLKNNY